MTMTLDKNIKSKKITALYSSLTLSVLASLAISLPVHADSAQGSENPVKPPHGVTIEDLHGLKRVSSPVLSPDAKYVAYLVRTTDVEKNRGLSDLWLINLQQKSSPPLRLSSSETGADAISPRWSADGKSVYFLSKRSGSMQLWKQSIADAMVHPAVMLSNLPLDVESFQIASTEDRVAFSVEVFRQCPDLNCTKERLQKTEQSKTSGRKFDQLFVRHWDNWFDGRRLALFSAPLSDQGIGKPVGLSLSLDADVHSKPHGDEHDYQFSQDGRQIVFSARVAGKKEAWSTNFDLYKVASDGSGTPENLTENNPAWDAKPSFSPDGKSLAYLAMKRPGFEADRFQIIIMDLTTGKKRLLAEKWDRSVSDYMWSQDSSQLYVSAHDLGQNKVFSIALKTGTVTPLTGLGEVAGFDVRGKTLVVAKNDLASPTELFTRTLDENLLKQAKTNQPAPADLSQLTNTNQKLLSELKMAEYEQFTFAGYKGEKVHGYVMKPWNFKAGEKYPIAFIVHGGPQGSYANSWGYRWNPQVYAGAGYAVVFIDFHGSTGYGQGFTDAISQNWGSIPLQDLKSGMAAASKQYPWLDQHRACALGASYGGYMMNWIQGNWSDGFKCIVSHAGVFDARSMYYSTEELWFNEWENGGTYFDNPAGHEKYNPVNYVKNWKTPMLVTQGELDFRIPTAQSLGSFTALQRRGIESQLLIFPDENHHILKPGNSSLWHHTVLNWLGSYLKK